MAPISRFILGCLFVLSASAAWADKPAPKPKPGKPDPGVTVTLRQVRQVRDLNPGNTFFLASACERGEEAVVGGGPGSIHPDPNLVLVASTLFYDGVGSGWLLMYRNNGSTTITGINFSVGALCVKGTIVNVVQD
jgi:hypothetical protein